MDIYIENRYKEFLLIIDILTKKCLLLLLLKIQVLIT